MTVLPPNCPPTRIRLMFRMSPRRVCRKFGIPNGWCWTAVSTTRRRSEKPCPKPDAFRKNYPFIARHFKAAVIGTTGWNDIAPEVFKAFEEAGTPMIYASNFSLGVNALFSAVRRTAELLRGAGYTPAIEEIHHIHKLDAPSGTAKSLGAIVEECFGVKPEITSVREGEVAGIHTLTLTSEADKLTLRHEAFSRAGFAAGAVTAALMTEGLVGVHEFSELLG